MPEYRLISRCADGEPPEIIDLLADNLEAVLAFLRRQQALIKPPAEVWHGGTLLLSLPIPNTEQFDMRTNASAVPPDGGPR